MTEQSNFDPQPTEAGLQLAVEAGNEFFEPGLTRLELGQDGQVLVTNQLEGKQQQFEGQVDAELAASLIGQVRSSDALMNPELGQRTGLPDEPRYHFEVYRNDQRLLSRNIWRSELEEYPDLEKLLVVLQDITSRFSDGEIIL